MMFLVLVLTTLDEVFFFLKQKGTETSLTPLHIYMPLWV